ncbi:MAG TPA: DUF5522 domain-containing protein [Humisphaera sp.]
MPDGPPAPTLSPTVVALHDRACRAGRPTYRDPASGYDVFTARFLKDRGFCCGSGCRHCPYGADDDGVVERQPPRLP